MTRLSEITTQKIKKLIELGWEIEEDGDDNYLMFIPPNKKPPYYEMREAFKIQFGEEYMDEK